MQKREAFEVRGGAVLHVLRKTTPVPGPTMFKAGENIKCLKTSFYTY